MSTSSTPLPPFLIPGWVVPRYGHDSVERNRGGACASCEAD
jgi:hypothetical protein